MYASLYALNNSTPPHTPLRPCMTIRTVSYIMVYVQIHGIRLRVCAVNGRSAEPGLLRRYIHGLQCEHRALHPPYPSGNSTLSVLKAHQVNRLAKVSVGEDTSFNSPLFSGANALKGPGSPPNKVGSDACRRRAVALSVLKTCL